MGHTCCLVQGLDGTIPGTGASTQWGGGGAGSVAVLCQNESTRAGHLETPGPGQRHDARLGCRAPFSCNLLRACWESSLSACLRYGKAGGVEVLVGLVSMMRNFCFLGAQKRRGTTNVVIRLNKQKPSCSCLLSKKGKLEELSCCGSPAPPVLWLQHSCLPWPLS